MDRELFEKNYMWLKKHANNQEGRVFSFVDEGWVPSEEDCFGIEVKGKYWNLCSAYDMEIPVSAWLEQECLQNVEYNSTMVMFGFGNPNYLANLVENFPQNSVIVIEPAERVIQAWAWVIDFEELFSKAEIIFLIGPLRQLRLMNYLGKLIGYLNMQNTKFLHVPNYLQMFPEEYAFLKEEIGVLVENALVGRNTLIGKGEDWSKNTLYNLYDLSQQYSTKDLCEAIKAAGLEDYPVVIVAAGPSLEDNIDALKAYQDRAVIIGINRSIPILEAHGIKSHINFLIDPGINPEQVGGPLMRQIPLVTVTSACAGFHQLHEGKRFYFAGDQFAFQLMQQVGHPLTEIDGGGSVATTAFVVAMNMGFKKMILIGQDLAFKDGQQYSMQSVNAQWSFVEEAKADGSSNKEGYFLVDGNNGNKVVTKYDYDYFRLWYERQIERNPQLHVINATEGGALIRGTAVMTLAEALERECPANPAGISEIIDKVKPIFGEEKRGYIEFLDAIELHMPELLDELKKGQELYKKLEALVRNNGYNHPKYSKYVKEVSRLNSKLEEDLGIMFLEQFDASGRYDVLDALSEKTGDEHSEIKLIVEQGLKSIENYMESAKRWREALDEVKEMLREKGTIE